MDDTERDEKFGLLGVADDTEREEMFGGVLGDILWTGVVLGDDDDDWTWGVRACLP